MTKLNYSYIGLGSNLGNKLQNILKAYQLIESRIGQISLKSHVYKTPPWGFESQDDFFNTAILVKTKLSALQLLEELKKIEQELGRDTNFKVGYSSRLIDLDILDFNNEVSSTVNLNLPHPHIEKRNFVLYPLFDLNENWVHPKTSVSIKILMKLIENSNPIERMNF